MATSPQSYVTQLDPNLNTQLLTAQQQLAMAQALRGQSLKPLQAPSGQNGVISPLSALAQGLMAYTSSKGMDAATQSLGDAQSKIAQFQAQDQADWLNHAGRYAPPPQQPQTPPQAPQQPAQDAPQTQGDPQQGQQPQQGQPPSPTGASQPTFPALTGQALGRYLQTMGSSDPQSGAPQGGQPAPQQAGQSTALNPMSAKNAMMAALLRGGSDAVGASDASPTSAPGGIPSTNGKGDPAPGQLGTGPTAGGAGFRPPSPSPNAYARILGQNTGAAGGMPDPMSDPSIRYLSVGASRGYVPGEVAGKAVDNFYRMNDNRTDLEKQLISNGVQPGSPEWNQAHKDMLAKNTYIAPVPVAQGTTMIDPKTRQVIIQSPKLADGMESDFSNPTNPSAHAVSGYAQGNAKNVGAARRAEQSNTVFTGVPGEGGSQFSGYGGNLFGGGGSGGGSAPAAGGPNSRGGAPAQGAQPGVQPGAQQAPASTSSRQGSGVIRGQSQTDKLLTDQGGQVYGRITSENTNNASHRQMLNEMSALAQSGQFGPGTGAMARVRALAKNANIDLGDAQTDQDVMKKLSSNLVMSQLGQGGTGTNDQMSSIQSMFPNGEMTNDAMKKVIPLLYSQIDAREARGNVANQFLNNGGQLSQLPGYLSKFNAIADPGTISLGRQMHAASANGTGKQLFNQIQAKYPKTWQGIIGRVQQLDQMGAF